MKQWRKTEEECSSGKKGVLAILLRLLPISSPGYVSGTPVSPSSVSPSHSSNLPFSHSARWAPPPLSCAETPLPSSNPIGSFPRPPETSGSHWPDWKYRNRPPCDSCGVECGPLGTGKIFPGGRGSGCGSDAPPLTHTRGTSAHSMRGSRASVSGGP